MSHDEEVVCVPHVHWAMVTSGHHVRYGTVHVSV